MLPSKKDYLNAVYEVSPKTKKIKHFILSFCVGGGICVLGQLIIIICKYFKIEEQYIKMIVPSALIILAALLTAFRKFDNIAKFAGAGTLVPITGFANAVVSAAMEYKTEGFILGVGAKMFTVAGPVIVYGTIASVIYGLVYWITKLF